MGAAAVSGCGVATASACSGCGSITVQADSKLARLAAARSAGNMGVLDGQGSSGWDGAADANKGLSARNRATTGIRDYAVPTTSISKATASFRGGEIGMGPMDTEDAKRRSQDILFAACREGNFKKTVDAITAGGDVHSRTLRGQTPLMLAAAAATRTALDTIRFLIDALSDVEAKDQEGWTALLHACRNNESEAREALVRCRCPCGGWAQLQAVMLLLDRNASAKARSADGRTAPMLATMDGGDNLVMELISKGATIDKKDDRHWSLLFYAVEAGRTELVKWLLRKHANVKDKAKDGTTVLMIAGQGGYQRIGERLLKRSAQMDATNTAGNTALMLCLKAEQEEFAEWLLEEGADVGPRNNLNEDAIDIAEGLGLHAMRGKLELKFRAQHEDI